MAVPALLDDVWLRVLSCFGPRELCDCAHLAPRFRALANADDLWHALCRARWADKQLMPSEDLFRNGNYSGVALSIAECKSLLQRRGISLVGIAEKSELLGAVRESTPSAAYGPPLPIPGKWKTSFAYAELDSQRQVISPDEISSLRWQLIYHGMPSSKGLRHFQRNGVYISPHFGETTWSLIGGSSPESRQHFQMQGVDPLEVCRNMENWGWIIGRGTGFEYHSVEVEL